MAEGITIREFIHKIGFAVSLDGLNAYEKSLERVDTKMEAMYGGANKLIGRLESMGKSLSMKLTLPILGLGTVSVMAREAREETETMWGTFLEGMDKGVLFTKQLRAASAGLGKSFTPDVVNQYAQSLFRLKIPVQEIIPMIKRFADIQAGTGINAGETMTEYAMARRNPMMRGMMLQRLMKQGAISEADIKAAGLTPQLMKNQAWLDRIGMDDFDRIFDAMAERNKGKAGIGSQTLGKNLFQFWFGLTKIREAIGGIIEKVGHLKGLLKGGAAVFTLFANWIENLPMPVKVASLVIGGLLAVIGPGFLALAAFARGLLMIRSAVTLLSMNPLIWQLAVIIASLVAVLLLFRAIQLYFKASSESGAINKQANASIVRSKARYGAALDEKVKRGEMTADQAKQAKMQLGSDIAGNHGTVHWEKQKRLPGLRGWLVGDMGYRKTFEPPVATASAINSLRAAALAPLSALPFASSASLSAPIVVHNTTHINVPPGATAETVRAARDAAREHVHEAAQHIVTQLNNARRVK